MRTSFFDRGAARQRKWDLDFLVDAMVEATKSKDPSTKVGAVIARPDGTKASAGYNGFPRGVDDTPERLADRTQKYPRTVHAELNAILMARESLKGHTIYTTLTPCAPCMGAIIQAGISRFVAISPAQDQLSRWKVDFDVAASMALEAGLEYGFYEEHEVHLKASLRNISFEAHLDRAIAEACCHMHA